MSLQKFHSINPMPSTKLVSRFLRATSHVSNCSPVGLQFKPSTGQMPSISSSDNTPSENEGISGIKVPKQRYIAASKSELLDAITRTMFNNSPDEANQFRHLSLCLDLILHAEHKVILEKMRLDYNIAEERNFMPNGSSRSDIELIKNLWPSGSNSKLFAGSLYVSNFLKFINELDSLDEESRKTAVSSDFQHALLQLLSSAGFDELSARDLRLTSALNTDYLLTLPISVDWKKASQSNAILFRRGYATERQNGLLIVEKLDYLQSKLLQRIFFLVLVKPLKWLTEVMERFITQDSAAQVGAKKFKVWLKNWENFQQTSSDKQRLSDTPKVSDISDDLPLLKAARNAVIRYEENLSEEEGPRGRLLKRLLMMIGLVPKQQQVEQLEIDDDNGSGTESPIFLSRISLSNIWEPASRKSCGNDVWKMLRTSISILLSRSTLQEPAYQELILLYICEVTSNLQLKIYEKIPIPDLPVVFPHKKLSFRILDSVRLDIASLLGLLAYFINYKFENISPSTILLDVIAVSALVLYVSRVVLGYKQTWDRYQLLVNRTLNEKTVASGFGSVYFLLDASEQQQYKEAILAYAVLLKSQEDSDCATNVGAKCDKFIYDVLDEKVEMAVDKAISTLVRLGIVTEHSLNGHTALQAIPCLTACEILKQHWNSLLR